VKDRIFSGQDVHDALAVAAASLGLPQAALRYVVLDAGTPAGRGLKPTPARVAVLLEDPHREASRPAPRADAPVPADPRAGLRSTLRAVVEAGGLDVEAEVEETEEAVVARLRGADVAFFLEPEGRGEVLRALEHLLHRMYGAALQPRSLRLTCEGFRERRDAALAAEARRLAAEVRAEGRLRTMEPLNAYERRVVHVALQGEPGVRTYSVGEGMERRVTVAPVAGEGPPAGNEPRPEAGDDRAD
jgi:spoIIIJ-associated protein